MNQDGNPPQDLLQAIESYERAVRKRHTLARRRAAPPPAAPRPPTPRRRPHWMQLAVVAGLVLGAAWLVGSPRGSGQALARRADMEVDPPDPSHRPRTGLTRIVLDPGHGGLDPGARAGELDEAAIVLDVATRLEARLRADAGFEVVLTRRDDVYLGLRARSSLANCVGADLFVSIHANASRDDVAGGIATYHLDPAVATPAARVRPAADRETLGPPSDSLGLAEMVQRHLIRAVRELHPSAKDMGVRPAKFMVLRGATMPSVLTEISFLTNEREAALLSTDAYRERISDALFQSILEFQESRPQTPRVTADGDN